MLKKIEVNGNADRFGGSNYETEIAVSVSIEKLQAHCKENYGQEATIGKPLAFEWVYFKIVETTLTIII